MANCSSGCAQEPCSGWPEIASCATTLTLTLTRHSGTLSNNLRVIIPSKQYALTAFMLHHIHCLHSILAVHSIPHPMCLNSMPALPPFYVPTNLTLCASIPYQWLCTLILMPPSSVSIPFPLHLVPHMVLLTYISYVALLP